MNTDAYHSVVLFIYYYLYKMQKLTCSFYVNIMIYFVLIYQNNFLWFVNILWMKDDYLGLKIKT